MNESMLIRRAVYTDLSRNLLRTQHVQKCDSGAQKRKIQKEKIKREMQLLSRIPRLTAYFKANITSPEGDETTEETPAAADPSRAPAEST